MNIPQQIDFTVNYMDQSSYRISDIVQKKCYMSSTHVSKLDILFSTMSLSIMWKILYVKLWRNLIILFIQSLFKEYCIKISNAI